MHVALLAAGIVRQRGDARLALHFAVGVVPRRFQTNHVMPRSDCLLHVIESVGRISAMFFGAHRLLHPPVSVKRLARLGVSRLLSVRSKSPPGPQSGPR